jgi:hypothetical protein
LRILGQPCEFYLRAQLFYSSFGGFEADDWTYGLRRALPPAAAANRQ